MNELVDALKRKLILKYVYLMSGILLVYSFVFYFIIKDSFFAGCTLLYSILMFYTFLVIRKNYNIKFLVHLYLAYAPLFAGFIMLDFWKYSAATAMWLLPVPFGAYIFLEKRYIYIYSTYIILIIAAVSILTKLFTFDYFNLDDVSVIVVSDTFVGVSNIMVFSLLIYFNEKIRKAEIERALFQFKYSESDHQDQIESELINSSEKEQIIYSCDNTEKYNILFNKVKSLIEEKETYKDAGVTISQLSNVLKCNNLYIAKAIKLNGYSNFNHYLNVCRVENVKKLLNENDISRVTLMYIYTESGFSNQSTFNRVFKQIEGITPSEYIMSINHEKNKSIVYTK
ncbi:helix-turn-helix domain-containing protein [Chryseobacterium sp. HR92]|uniref:helix-turn-helix domain-containing protein n=1 Tax=Chryseobacterium sp. HR92 TaxID=3094839 RepID=UPI003890453B|nr:helix-turn-helix domain-containing protein [Chryseobacterium sp. HR92]